MANITPKSKRNPWRNTRRDYDIPWDSIKGAILVFLIPFVILTLALNLTYRSSQFYSFYFTRTDVVKDIPFVAEGDDMTHTFSRFMQHRMERFTLTEKSDYKPQEVFNLRDGQVMYFLRKALDIQLFIGFICGLLALIFFIQLYRKGKKALLYERFIDSQILLTVFLAVHMLLCFVVPVRDLLFRYFFGVRFPPGDVLIQIFQSKLPEYGAVSVLLISLLILAIFWYLARRSISRRKMFRSENLY